MIPCPQVHDANYSVALEAVDQWIDSTAGVPETTFESLEAFMDDVAKLAIAEGDVVSQGLPWVRRRCLPRFSIVLPHFRLYEVVSLHMCVPPYKYRIILEMLLNFLKVSFEVMQNDGEQGGLEQKRTGEAIAHSQWCAFQ